jgi:hypothetical protein
MSYNKASFWSGMSLALSLQCADADSSIPFTVLWVAFQGPAEPTYRAITSREQWVQFWKQLRVKPMGGYSIAIQRIWDDSVNIRVSIQETSPGRNCAGTAMSVAPFVGASIPETTKKVVFDISRAEAVCN